MKKIIYSALKALVFISFVMPSYFTYGQDTIDDPNLDHIPKWYFDQIQKSPRQNSQVITVNDYDNFFLGTDFAEGHISVNPTMDSEFFTAFNTDGAHYTMDGNNWSSSNPAWGTSMRGDPVTAYDSLGNLYYENMYGASIQGCKVVKSTDNGQTWGAAVNAITGNDKNWIACDQTAGPYANYVYSTMTNSGTGNFVRSTDHGLTWQSTFAPSTQSLPGMMVCVGPNQNVQGGSVYVVTNSGSSFSSTYTFYESNDGGSTFQLKSSQNFAGYVGTNVNGRNSVMNMRTRPYPFITADNSFGAHRGRLYLVYASNDPPGDGHKPDIWNRYSDDGGSTWSNAKRVNSGLFPTASSQWQPATWCDKETGRLYIQWMDTRNTPTNDSALIYATYSDDGGQSFKTSQKISNEKMKINCSSCGGGGTPRYEGDYNGIVSNSDVSNLCWGDFRWGSFASFTSYFPDFAMRVFPVYQQISYKDTLWAVIPDTKLYENQANFSATIEDPSSGSFQIDFPSGNSLSSFPDSIPIVITVNGVPVGQYVATVTGEGPNGTPIHFRDATIEVIPIQPPVADFSASSTNICLNTAVNFTDESTNNPDSWLWTFAGGNPATSTNQNPTEIVYATAGSYDVTLEVSNTSGSDVITKPNYITVNVLPDPPTGENMSICKNLDIPPLEAIGIDIIWYSDPELTEVVFNGNIFYTGDTLPGNYTYYATQTVNGCESSYTELTLTIYDTPNVSFTPLDTVCVNTEIFNLTNGLPVGGNYFGPGVINGTFQASVAGEGTHTLGYAYADENTCADTAYQDITVRSLPEVTFDPLTPVCVNAEATTLTGGSPSGGIYSGDGVLDNIFYPETAGYGNHDITYIITDVSGCSNSASQTMVVYELPQVNIGNDTTVCGSQDVTLDATLPNATSYLWFPGDFTTPTITVDSSGIGYNSQEFNAFVTDDNGCTGSGTTTVTFINCTGINEIVGLEHVGVYPNPNEGTFNLSITSSKTITISISIFDAMGERYLELTKLEISGNYSTKVNMQDVKSGLYFITIENSEGTFIRKFIVR